MNVLEKILEEISEVEKEHVTGHKVLYALGATGMATEISGIIRSHMGGATDTDDTEEKIRVHIAECLHRIDNIRSFIESKEYTSNDEKCIRNIEVLKTSITALEEYLSSKKKNGDNGWIPVEERLPEEENERYYPILNVTTSQGVVKDGFYRVRDKKWYIYSEFRNEFVEAREGIIAWRPPLKPYKEK